ncbi:MAG: hypothetical protein H7101_03130 [Deinococcales bacterium]|nr:hypothetical protein [Chitinophagaceae bacterium]
MKKLLFNIFALTTISIILMCCQKNDEPVAPNYTCVTCKNTPTALAANDASNKGIYKGTVIGSTGTIQFDLSNNGTTITAVMVINGTTVNLTSNVSVVAGQTYVAPFTGTLNGQAVSITFSVSAVGQNPVVTTSSIPGHPNSSFNILKETSTSLIECFEGTYSTTKPEAGTFNLILSRSLKIHNGASRKTGATSSNSFSGTIDANNNLIDATNGKTIATLSGDNLAATFVDGGGSTVTVIGKRTF